MKQDPNALLFRELPMWLQDRLRTLSRDGYIYIGRTGPGLTWDFRRACMKRGTLKAIDETMAYHDIEDKLIVELIATEGPRWVPYQRIREYCQSGVYQILRQKEVR